MHFAPALSDGLKFIVVRKWEVRSGERNWTWAIFFTVGAFAAGVIGWNGELKKLPVGHVWGMEMCGRLASRVSKSVPSL